MQPRVVVITGASSGIGRATAIRFAKAGWRVGLIARGEEGLEAVCKDVVENGGTAAMAGADVAQSGPLEAAAASIEATLGLIEVWVNNAGVGVWGWFDEIPEEEFRRVTEVNYFGIVNGSRIALRRMAARDRGTIVQVLSVISYRGVPLQTPYSGAKYAARGFTEALRAELFAKGSRVHVTMVHPPSTNTPFYDNAVSHMGRKGRPPPPVYQPELIADAIYTAATTRRRELKVGEQTLALAFGNMVAPGLMDVLSGKFGVAPQLRAQDDPAPGSGNLHTPSRSPGIHGAFDRESVSHSPQAWLNKNRDALGLGLGLIALAWLAGSKRV